MFSSTNNDIMYIGLVQHGCTYKTIERIISGSRIKDKKRKACSKKGAHYLKPVQGTASGKTGFLDFSIENFGMRGSYMEIFRIGIEPKYRNMGHGKSLLENASTIAYRRGTNGIWGRIHEEEYESLGPFFLKHGFTETTHLNRHYQLFMDICNIRDLSK